VDHLKSLCRAIAGVVAIIVIAASYCESVFARDQQTVAVWEFEDRSPGIADPKRTALGKILSATLQEKLIDASVPVVERERLNAVLAEQKLGSSALADPTHRLSLGRILGAQRMVFGEFMDLAGVTRLDVRGVNSETGAILFAETSTLPTQTVASQFDELAQRVVAQFVSRSVPESLPPELHHPFRLGIEAMEQRAWKVAIPHFSVIVQLMPDLTIAQSHLRFARAQLQAGEYARGQR
jgi:hypothetical protein